MTNTERITSSETRLKGAICEIIDTEGGLTIINTDKNNTWECIASDVDGYYYFRNEATGEYLALVTDNTETPNRQVVTTPTTGEYNTDAYLIGCNISSNENVYSKQSLEYVSGTTAKPNSLVSTVQMNSVCQAVPVTRRCLCISDCQVMHSALICR